MTLEESLAKLKIKIEGSMPQDQLNIMHQATKALEDSDLADHILKIGDKAPSFNLPNQLGEIKSSKDYLKKGPLVITFYRGLWCPYCNIDLSNLKRYTKDLTNLGASMVSISPQIQTYNQKIVDRQRLNFDLLSDRENKVADAFGLRWTMQDPLRSLYDNIFKINLPTYNGDDSWTLPVPARFIIDTNGNISYAEYSIDYRKRPNPDVLIAALTKSS